MTPEERAALWAELDTMKDALEELRKPAVRLTSAQVAEILAELKRMRAAGLFPIVVKLTGDATKDAAALEAALMRGKPLHAAVDTAVRFIVKCLEGADSSPKAARFGAPFEQALPWLMENLSG